MPADDAVPLPMPRIRGEIGRAQPVVAAAVAGYGLVATKAASFLL